MDVTLSGAGARDVPPGKLSPLVAKSVNRLHSSGPMNWSRSHFALSAKSRRNALRPLLVRGQHLDRGQKWRLQMTALVQAFNRATEPISTPKGSRPLHF